MSVQLNTEAEYVSFVRSLPGSILTARHKAPNRKGHVVSLEVTGVAKIPTRYGEKTYVVGTRLDGDQAGKVNTMRLDAMVPKSIEVVPAKGFKPADLTGYFIRPQSANAETVNNFAWMEKLEDPDDISFAIDSGLQPLTDFMVADKVQPVKKTRKAKPVVEQPTA
jgi:hypothetical protein